MMIKNYKNVFCMFTLLCLLFCFTMVNADTPKSLTSQSAIFVPIAPGSFVSHEIVFNPMEDPDMTYLIENIRALPDGYKMKISLDGQCIQRKDIIGPLKENKNYTLQIGIYADDTIETGREVTTRWAIGPAEGEDTSSSVILQVFAYALAPKHIQMVLDKREVVVNGQLVMLDVPAQVMQSRTMVPFRFLGEQLGAKVAFEMNPETRLVSQVSFSIGKLSVTLWINQTEAEVRVDRSIQKKELDVAPVIVNGRTLVPVRFVVEEMGAGVEWVAERREVNIFFPRVDEVPKTPFLVFFQDISVSELYESYETGEWKILDIRVLDDYKKGHLPGAIHVPMHLLNDPEGLKTYHLNYDDNIVVYCNSGVQSTMGSERLVRQGFTKVFNLLGGIKAWPYDIES
jgi:rhodanese-related sulfurtransferase